jgi:hypothetical protein
MQHYKSAAFGLALTAFSGIAGFAHTASAAEAMMSDSDHKMMTSCMAMSHDEMMKDSNCAGMMKKMNMTDNDMMKMKSCMGMSHDSMMKNTDCAAMEKMHPDMMKTGMMEK